MSNNDRIDRVLKENNLEFVSFAYPNMYPRIRKAIGQYGNEMYHKGSMDSTIRNREIDLEAIKCSEITRLHSLVKAQKELIAVYEKAITLGEPDVWELYLKIKELES